MKWKNERRSSNIFILLILSFPFEQRHDYINYGMQPIQYKMAPFRWANKMIVTLAKF